jgi:hypothetical protein
MGDRWHKVFLALAVLGLAGAVYYWMRHEAARPKPTSTAPRDAGPLGDGATGDGRARPTDASIIDAAVYARITVGGGWVDITARGMSESVQKLCEAIVADELGWGVAGAKPALSRACLPQELPAIPEHAEFELIETRTGEGNDFAPLGSRAFQDTSALVQRVSQFATAARCEQIRQKLANADRYNAASATNTAAAAITQELDKAKADRDRECKPGAETASPCARARDMVAILERVGARPGQGPAPRTVQRECRSR